MDKIAGALHRFLRTFMITFGHRSTLDIQCSLAKTCEYPARASFPVGWRLIHLSEVFRTFIQSQGRKEWKRPTGKRMMVHSAIVIPHSSGLSLSFICLAGSPPGCLGRQLCAFATMAQWWSCRFPSWSTGFATLKFHWLKDPGSITNTYRELRKFLPVCCLAKSDLPFSPSL